MRWAVFAVCLLGGCSSEELYVVLEGEDLPFNAGPTEIPIGAGLVVHVDVVRESFEFGDEDPTQDTYATAELDIVTLDGATLASCTSATGFCIVADGPRVRFVIDTPNGRVESDREVVADLALATLTPNWGRAPVDRIHLEANATNDLQLVAKARTGRRVAGRVIDVEITGDLTLDLNRDAIVGAPGIASISVANAPTIAPLEIEIVTEQDSLASITRFTANRVFSDRVDGDVSLTAYTEGSVGADLFDGFDADGFLALPGLPIDVIGGPGVTARPWPVGDGPCVTNSYCFLRGVLDDGVASLETYVELQAGAAIQRFPVHVIRGEY